MALYSRTRGEGDPVILIHGLFGSMENLGAQARALSERFCVHSVDLPNHGRSPHSTQMTLASMAAQLREWMDEQSLERAHIIGHSLGGKVAMELALTNPERCHKLAVLDIAPVQYEPRHNDVFAAFNAVDPALLGDRKDADALMKPYVSELAVRSFLLKNLVKVEQSFAWRMNLPALTASYHELIGQNRCDATFDGPVLFIKGGDSSYITEAYRDAIGSRFPQAKLNIVPATGHWLHAEKPEQVARILARFLQ